MKKKTLRMMGWLLVIATLMTLLAAPALAFKARTIRHDAMVYGEPKKSAWLYKTLDRGTTVEVLDYKGQWAMCKKGGRIAYLKVTDLASCKPVSDVTLLRNTTVKLIKGGKKLKLAAGTKLYVYGTNCKGSMLVGDRKGSNYAYISKKKLG